MKRRRRGREKTKTERFLQSFFASNTFPLGSFWCLRQACQHRQQRKKKGGKWNLEVPGWTYIGVHKRKKRDARTKGAETDYTVSHREKPVHREISLVFPSTARPLGWIPTVEKKKKRPTDSELNVEDSWANGNPLIARVLSLWQTFALSMWRSDS